MCTITINNIRVNYRDQGKSSEPVLLLIHGLGCSLRYWTCVFEASELSGYRIIALDLPGFGRSEKPDNYDYRLFSQADIVLAFLEALHIQDCSLIGHSMGGAIAILIAIKHAHHVKQLLVIEPNLKACDAHLSREIVQYPESTFITHYDEFRSSAIATVKSWFVNFQQTDLDVYIDELLRTTPISMYRSALSLITSTSDDTLLNQFQQLTLPKHFLIGEESLKTHSIPEGVEASDVHITIVPGVGHMMMIDNPSLFNKTLATVL